MTATSVGDATFLGCSSLTEINIPKVTKIGRDAFDGCTDLRVITIKSLKIIGKNAFDGCENIERINVEDKRIPPNSTTVQQLRKLGIISNPAVVPIIDIQTISYLNNKMNYEVTRLVASFLKGGKTKRTNHRKCLTKKRRI